MRKLAKKWTKRTSAKRNVLREKLCIHISKSSKKKQRHRHVTNLLERRFKLNASLIEDQSTVTQKQLEFTNHDNCSAILDSSHSSWNCLDSTWSNSMLENQSDVPTNMFNNNATDDDLSHLFVLQLPHSSSSVLVVMKHVDQCGVTLHGVTRVKAIKGSLRINGYELPPGKTTAVAAPLTHPAVVINVYGTQEKGLISYESFHETDAEFIKNQVSEWDVVILFQNMSNFFKPRVLPGYPDIFTVKPSDVCLVKDICKGAWACKTSRCFQEYDYYTRAFSQINSWSATRFSQGAHPVVVTTGGKNTGKSTFNRYLVNAMLARHACVYYLECDVGQTEFTPSGQISINRINNTDPLISPPFCHQRDPILSCYYGNNTPAGDPDRYIECIQFVISNLYSALNGCIGAPLVVNTMGWNRALGLQLLIDIIRLVNPTHIVQLFTEKESKNTIPLTNANVAVANGWLTSPQQQGAEDRFDHISLNVTHAAPTVVKYMAPDMRNLSLLAYLSSMVERCQERSNAVSATELDRVSTSLTRSLQAIKPYAVQTEKIVICNASDNPVKLKHVYLLLNASMVGLCTLEAEVFRTLKEKEKMQDDFIHPAQACTCLGLGLVRGVQPDTGTLFVLSHLPPHAISRVNCLIGGTSVLPESILLQQHAESRESLYVSNSFSYDVVGSGMFRVHRKFSKFPSGK